MVTNENNGAPENEANAPDFSRAVARRRWESEAIADEVYDFRVKTRKRLQAEGLTRKQAGEEMWKLALAKYPSPEEKLRQQREATWGEIHQAMDAIRERGDHPPANVAVPEVGGVDFADVWCAFYNALAAQRYVEGLLDVGFQHGPLKIDDARKQAGGQMRMWQHFESRVSRRAMCAWAIIELADFLRFADGVFAAELERQQQLDGADESLDMLETAHDELAAMRQPRVERPFWQTGEEGPVWSSETVPYLANFA